MSEAANLCVRFIEQKNAGDPAPAALLLPRPAWPEEAVAQEEADHLQADLFLREVPLIEGMRPEPGAGDARFILMTQGNVAAPPLSVRTANNNVERSQRTMTNPEIIVEIRDGKVRALRAQLGS
jgi:hypothetical protein